MMIRKLIFKYKYNKTKRKGYNTYKRLELLLNIIHEVSLDNASYNLLKRQKGVFNTDNLITLHNTLREVNYVTHIQYRITEAVMGTLNRREVKLSDYFKDNEGIRSKEVDIMPSIVFESNRFLKTVKKMNVDNVSYYGTELKPIFEDVVELLDTYILIRLEN